MGGSMLFRIGHAGANMYHGGRALAKRAPNPSCATGGFYTSPTSGQVVDSSKPLLVTWDNTCLNATAVDIYLYSYPANASASSGVIQMFNNVYFPSGSYEMHLKPKWWNSAPNASLQLSIVKHASQPFEATALPAAPIWTATYDPTTAGQQPQAIADTSGSTSTVTQVNNTPEFQGHGGISRGAKAAAVLLPLLFLVGLVAFLYIRRTRAREAAKRKEWSEKVDKRMSVISTDWRSMTAKGAEAAVRASVYGAGANEDDDAAHRISQYRSSVYNSRASTYRNSMAQTRASSTFAVEDSTTLDSGSSAADGASSHVRRTGVGPRGATSSMASGERASRISFAADTRFSRASVAGTVGRPSGESRRAGVASRAFHESFVPPVPSLKHATATNANVNKTDDSSSDSDGPERAISPTQRDGPLTLSAEDIRARVRGLQGKSGSGASGASGVGATGLGASETEARPSIDEVIPALSMMRMANGSQADLLFAPASPGTQTTFATSPAEPIAAPPPAASPPMSPVMQSMPMQSLGAGFGFGAQAMSPDDMLRVYAERRRTGASNATSSIGTPTSPGPIANPISYPPPVATSITVTTTTTTSTSGASIGASSAGSTQVGSNNPYRKSMAPTTVTGARASSYYASDYDDDDDTEYIARAE